VARTLVAVDLEAVVVEEAVVVAVAVDGRRQMDIIAQFLSSLARC
jgi:hypothetical protein